MFLTSKKLFKRCYSNSGPHVCEKQIQLQWFIYMELFNVTFLICSLQTDVA